MLQTKNIAIVVIILLLFMVVISIEQNSTSHTKDSELINMFDLEPIKKLGEVRDIHMLSAKLNDLEENCQESCEVLRDRSYEDVCKIWYCREIAIPEHCS